MKSCVTNMCNDCSSKNKVNCNYNYVGCERMKTLYTIKFGNKDCSYVKIHMMILNKVYIQNIAWIPKTLHDMRG